MITFKFSIIETGIDQNDLFTLEPTPFSEEKVSNVKFAEGLYFHIQFTMIFQPCDMSGVCFTLIYDLKQKGASIYTWF